MTNDLTTSAHEDELKQNGYRVLKGKSLKNMKLAQVDDINVVDLSVLALRSNGTQPRSFK